MVDVAAKLKEHQTLQGLRQPHEALWRDCFDYTHPHRGIGFQDESEDATSIQMRKARITDPTGTDAARICAAMIHSGMTPANSRWFSLSVDDADDEAQRWLDKSAELLWENIHMGNFDAAGFDAMQDGVDAGWFVLYVDEAKEGGLHFESWPLHQVYCAASESGGLIDVVHRRYKLTAQQTVNEFGVDAVSEAVRKLADEKPSELVDIVHIIEPRPATVANGKLSRHLPFASLHIEVKGARVLRESGYHEMPVMVPRWSLIAGSVYATGLVSDALPSIKRLNEIVRMQMAAGDLATAGMWIAQDDGVLNPRTVKVGPRKVIVANSVDSMKPLLTGSDFNISIEFVNSFRSIIRKMLLADQLQPQDGPQMTAYEVHVRVNLIRQLLGPTFGRFQSEYLSPLISRCFGLAYRAGIFLPPPESLQGRSFSVKYISPLARAQKLEEVTAIQQYVAATIQAGQVLPEIMDNCDFDLANRKGAEGLGVPAEIVRTQQDRDALRKQRIEAQQRQAEQQQMAALAQEAGSAVVQKAVQSA